MIENESRLDKLQQKAKIRERYKGIDPGMLEVIPAKSKRISTMTSHGVLRYMFASPQMTLVRPPPMSCRRTTTRTWSRSTRAGRLFLYTLTKVSPAPRCSTVIRSIV